MRAWLTWVLGIVLVVTVCASNGPAAPAPKQIVILQSAEPKSLDPIVEGLSHTINVIGQVLDPLVWFTYDLKADPRLAVSWRNLDPLTWEVKLRPGVKFTNGEPFNADAVVESFKYLTKPGAVRRAQLAAWETIERVDDLTVRVRTRVPDARFLFGLIWMDIMPPGVLKSNPDSLADRPVGTGPFKVVEWVKGERIVLEANDGYWRGRPKIDRVIFKAVPEASARVAALRAEQADLIVNVPPDTADLLDKGPNTKVVAVAGLRNVTIIFDTRTTPFNDVRVRKAMNYAIDKESINRNIFGGRAVIQATPSHPLTFGHNPTVKPYPYDVEKAKSLLAEAGYPNGFEVEFHHPSGRWLKDVEVAQAVAGMLSKVGVRTKLTTGEYGTFFANWAKGDFKGMTMIGTLNLIDADQVIGLFLYSKGTWPHYWRDSKLDAMYERVGEIVDREKRRQFLREMEAYLSDQAPWLFLYFQTDLYGANRKLKWRAPANELRISLWDADLE